ncbi:MAG: CPBP family intramembrane glutamic endopeptidase [Fidelibacterota bacterium]
MNYLKEYWQESRSPLYSLIFTLPLIIVYEGLLFTMNHSDIAGMRNGADALIRQFFAMFGIYGFYLVGFVILLVLFLIYLFQHKNRKLSNLNKQFFLLMLLESMFYATLLNLVLNKFLTIPLMNIESLNNREIIAMSIGAGVYEELVFRIIFLQAIVIISRYLLRLNKVTSVVMGIILSSVIFSGFHYIGPMGDSINIISFTFRFIAGIMLATIYILRGYGIAVYSHALYDLLLFF